MLLEIFIAFVCFALCFPRYFLQAIPISMLKKSTSVISHSKNVFHITKRPLKQQFSKMADAGNMQVLKSSFSNSLLSDSKSERVRDI